MGIKNTALTKAGSINIFGRLDSIPVWDNLPYVIKGPLLRGLKAGVSVLVAGLLTAATAGTLFPVAWGPAIIVVLTMALQAVDKYIREWNIEEDSKDDEPEV